MSKDAVKRLQLFSGIILILVGAGGVLKSFTVTGDLFFVLFSGCFASAVFGFYMAAKAAEYLRNNDTGSSLW